MTQLARIHGRWRHGLSIVLLVGCPLAAQTYPYRAIDLGTVPGQSPLAGVGCSAISDNGAWVGGTSVWEPYVFEVGVGMRALPKLPGQLNASVEAVNDAGFAVGSSGLTSPVAVLWDPQGNVRSLGGLGGSFSGCTGINRNNVVIGVTQAMIGSQSYSHAFTWTAAGGLVDLTPGVAGNSEAHDINDAGQICLDTLAGPGRFTPGSGMLLTGTMVPYRINEYGQMAGKDMWTSIAGRYTDGVGWEMFGAGSPIGLRHVRDINGLGQIVGSQWTLQNPSPPSYLRRGYLYTFGLGWQRVESWIDPRQQVRVEDIRGITDTGLMVADGSIGPDNRALLLEPRFVSTYGSGCAPVGGNVPRLGATGMPARGGRVALLGAGGSGGGLGLFVLAGAPAATPWPGGCQVLVDLTAPVTFLVALNPIGQGQVMLDVPSGVPAMSVFAQWASLGSPGSPASVAMSNGVRIDLQ
ncbi:MAG: hypothetical protein IPK26_02645 [Planctomycetes bacterium]|nr:hypothetical protein [Planctomycetota bacterium]